MKPILIPIGVLIAVLTVMLSGVLLDAQTNTVTPKAIVTDGNEYRVLLSSDTLSRQHYASFGEAMKVLEAERDATHPGHWTNGNRWTVVDVAHETNAHMLNLKNPPKEGGINWDLVPEWRRTNTSMFSPPPFYGPQPHQSPPRVPLGEPPRPGFGPLPPKRQTAAIMPPMPPQPKSPVTFTPSHQ